jgi:2-oxo-4-hydroxy-4-carboxy-5-ureidoimidazoline decarboxylase
MSLESLNQMSSEDAAYAFLQCCTSDTWVQRMVKSRPFVNEQDLRDRANQNWTGLQESDYLQAFNGHPKIGDVNSLAEKYANTKTLAASEQSSVGEANGDTIKALAQGNTDYHRKFGFIFIVCATGKSALQMSELLNARIGNDRATELHNAAEEQRKIFQLRLGKLL